MWSNTPLDFDVIDGWDNELSQMNNSKVGEQLSRLIYASTKLPSIPDYSTISRRVNSLEIKINEKLGNDIIIALDSTGIKVAN